MGLILEARSFICVPFLTVLGVILHSALLVCAKRPRGPGIVWGRRVHTEGSLIVQVMIFTT